MDSIYDSSFDFFFNNVLVRVWLSTNKQLFNSFILDLFTNWGLYDIEGVSSWYRSILYTQEGGFILFTHPELLFILKSYTNDIMYGSNSLYMMPSWVEKELVVQEAFNVSANYLPNLLVLLSIMTLFVIAYFSFYSSAVKEESLIDADYLTISGIYESEKEITAFDDIILMVSAIVLLFFWFFGANVLASASLVNSMKVLWVLVPLLYYFIGFFPTVLLWDYGVYFLVYLRGCGGSKVFFIEFFYDFLALLVYYIRLVVQNVRLVLCIVTFINMHDLVLHLNFNSNSLLASEDIIATFVNDDYSLNSSYFAFINFPKFGIEALFELFHTLFILVLQSIAFFAIVFWLFLFFYTTFILGKIENYFTQKRQARQLEVENFYNKFQN